MKKRGRKKQEKLVVACTKAAKAEEKPKAKEKEENAAEETKGKASSLWQFHEHQTRQVCGKVVYLHAQQQHQNDPARAFATKSEIAEALKSLTAVVTKLL